MPATPGKVRKSGGRPESQGPCPDTTWQLPWGIKAKAQGILWRQWVTMHGRQSGDREETGRMAGMEKDQAGPWRALGPRPCSDSYKPCDLGHMTGPL